MAVRRQGCTIRSCTGVGCAQGEGVDAMEREASLTSGKLSRRTALRLLGSGSAMALLVACGAPAATPAGAPVAPTPPPAAAATANPAPAPTSSTAATPATNSAAAVSTAGTPVARSSGEPSGTLTVAYGDLGSQLFDPTTSLYGVPLYLVYEPLL